MSTREKPALDAAKREGGTRVIKGFDKGVLKQIADVVSVPPENRDAFYRDLYWLLRVLVENQQSLITTSKTGEPAAARSSSASTP
jgi:hypothetical protein